ncbi:hypothetical protein [Actinocorallia aurea]
MEYLAQARAVDGAGLRSDTESVTRWARRVFDPWWPAADAQADAIPSVPVVQATVDESFPAAFMALVEGKRPTEGVFGGRPVWFRWDGKAVVATTRTVGMLRVEGHPVQVFGANPDRVAVVAYRVLREVARARLVDAGWTLIRASAAVGDDGGAVLFVGAGQRSMSAAALMLAAAPGWKLLASERVFARHAGEDRVELLPWPGPVTVGISALRALGLRAQVTGKLTDGIAPYPVQEGSGVQFLQERRMSGMWSHHDPVVALWPDQIPDWLGVGLGTSEAHVDCIVHPVYAPMETPTARPFGVTLPDDLELTAQTDPRYQDVLGLSPRASFDARTAGEALAGLRRWRATLGAHGEANAALLASLADGR